MTATERKWRERVRGWRESGQTAPDFSTGRGFSAGGLRYWAHRLKKVGIVIGTRTGVKTAAAKTTAARRKAPDRVRLIRLDRIPSAMPGLASLTVEVGGARLRVPGGYPELLRTTIGALMAAVEGGGH
jgi:hypothetical protein